MRISGHHIATRRRFGLGVDNVDRCRDDQRVRVMRAYRMMRRGGLDQGTARNVVCEVLIAGRMTGL